MTTPITCIAVSAVLSASDIEATIAWLTPWLGAPAVRPTPDVAEWLITSSAWLQVVTDPKSAGNGGAVLAVADLDAAVTALEGLGIPVTDRQTIPGVVALANLRDPDANTITLVQEVG